MLQDEQAVYGGDYIERLCERLAHRDKGADNADPRAVGEWAGESILEEYIKNASEKDENIF